MLAIHMVNRYTPTGYLQSTGWLEVSFEVRWVELDMKVDKPGPHNEQSFVGSTKARYPRRTPLSISGI
jgi:hypothetical protein